MKRVSWMSGFALCLAVVAGSTVMATTVRSTVDVAFPGVDVDGNLDDSLGADGVVKATFNSRTGRLRLVGRAVVENDSHRTHVYTNAGVIDAIGVDGNVVTDRYRVTARGRASYTGLVTDSTGITL